MTPPSASPALTEADQALRDMPDALRVALADDAENLAVALTEAVLADGLGFKGPFEEFGRIADPILLDALGAARRDGAQLANDAAAGTITKLRSDLAAAMIQISDLAQAKGEAEGRLRASETVVVVEGWRDRALKAEEERDQALVDLSVAQGPDPEEAFDEIGMSGRKTTLGKHKAANYAHIRKVIGELDAAGMIEAADTLLWAHWWRQNERSWTKYARESCFDRATAAEDSLREREAEIGRLKIAFHDAIRRPLGVTPDSGAEFYDHRMAGQAEARRAASVTTAPKSQASYWPDGSLKHRWERRRGIAKRLCAWCGQTAGPSTIGWACRATFRPDLALAPTDPITATDEATDVSGS